MHGSTRRLILNSLGCFALLGSAFSGAAFAHEGDGKVLDRQPPYQGPGYHSPLGPLGNPLPGFLPTSGSGSFTSQPFSSNNVKLLSWLPLNTWGTQQQNGNSGWGYVSPSGRRYAIIGLYSGTGFAEITNPGQTVNVGYINGVDSLWRDVRTYSHYAYTVSEGGGGIQIIDLANIDNGVVTLVGNVTSGPTPSATHTLEINTQTGYLYRAGGGSNGLRIYNLNPNPASPTYVSSWTTRYVHEVTLVNYTSGPLAGKEIAFACSGSNGGGTNTGVDVLDVTNKAAITSVTAQRLTWPSGQYSHQCTLSSDKTRLYLNDELYVPNLGGPTTNHVFDISGLGTTQPTFIGTYGNGNPAIPHNNYILGSKLYQAAYRSGLRVYDTTANPNVPNEVAWFDTYNNSDSAQFNGLWNVYPFHPGGVVTGSDLESGLFVWWVGAHQLTFAFPNGQPATIPNTGFALRVQINEAQAGLMSPGTERLWYRVNGGAWTNTALTNLGGGQYDANFPAVPCNSLFDYYVTATTGANGVVWSSPDDAPTSFHSTTASTCIPAPVIYCTAKINSLGCVPAVGYAGTAPSVSAGSGFIVQGSDVRNNKVGVMLYSLAGRNSSPLGGGFLCVASPFQRVQALNSGGTPPPTNDCSGIYSVDVNAFIAGGTGNPGLQVPGNVLRMQFWGRDPGFTAPDNVTLTDALEAVIVP